MTVKKALKGAAKAAGNTIAGRSSIMKGLAKGAAKAAGNTIAGRSSIMKGLAKGAAKGAAKATSTNKYKCGGKIKRK